MVMRARTGDHTMVAGCTCRLRRVYMEWLAENWFWVVIGILFVAMHMFGHGGHGGHGGGGHGGHGAPDKPDKPDSDRDRPSGHQH